MDKKPTKIPSVTTLYVKYYAKLKKKNNVKQDKKKKEDNITEAIKSWNALSKSEQKLFYDKYHDLCKMQKQKIAKSLKESEPYLKKKNITIAPDQTSRNNIQMTEADLAEISKSPSLSENIDPNHICTIEENSNLENRFSPVTLPQRSLHKDTEKPMTLAEPTPPSVISAKQLFEKIKLRDKENLSSWESLSKLEKGRYQRAVLLQKKEYIQRYKAFLDNLSSEELYNYCHKTNK